MHVVPLALQLMNNRHVMECNDQYFLRLYHCLYLKNQEYAYINSYDHY